MPARISLLRTPALLVTAIALFLASPPARAQETEEPSGDETLTKRKEGRYTVEFGEIFFRSDDYGLRGATVDEDGIRGPAPARDLEVQTDSLFHTNPYVSFGYLFPNNKMTANFSQWQVNAGEGYFTTSGWEEDMTADLGIPGLAMVRTDFSVVDPNDFEPIEVPNPVEKAKVRLDREISLYDAELQRTLWEKKKFVLRWSFGARYLSYQERIDAIYNYGEEQIPLGAPNLLFKYNDSQFLEANADTKFFGPKLGLHGRIVAGEKSRWVFRGGLAASVGRESTSIQYENRAFEVNPLNLDFRFLEDPSRGAAGAAWAPLGVDDRNLGVMDINIRDVGSHEIVWVGDAYGKVEFLPVNWLAVGFGFDLLHLHDFLSARDIVDRVNSSISNIRIAEFGLQNTDPRDDKIVTLYDWEDEVAVGEEPAEADIRSRRSYTFEGLRVYVRFNF